MTDQSKDIQINAGINGPVIKTVAEYDGDQGHTAHYQGIQLFFKGSGSTSEVATSANPMPVTIPSTGSASPGAWLSNFNDSLTQGTGGETGFLVIIDPASGISASLAADLSAVVGITSDGPYNRIAVYGLSGAGAGGSAGIESGWNEPFFCVTGPTGTSGRLRTMVDVWATSVTAGVTGDVRVHGLSGAGNVGITGYVTVFGNTAATPVPVNTVASGITLAGGVTGMHPLLVSTGVIGEGSTLEVERIKQPLQIAVPTGLTWGQVTYSRNDNPTPAKGLTHGIHLGKNHGLSSGVKVTVFNTGTTGDYVWVGGPTAGTPGLTVEGYPLRQFDSIFLEVNNVNAVFVAADNAAADIRFVGS